MTKFLTASAKDIFLKNFNLPFEGNTVQHWGKKRKCWLLVFPPFPTNVFREIYFLKVIKNLDSVVKD